MKYFKNHEGIEITTFQKIIATKSKKTPLIVSRFYGNVNFFSKKQLVLI
jgi:hypothetical protein